MSLKISTSVDFDEQQQADDALCSAPSVSVNRERDDAYRHVVLKVTDRWRIASCSEGLQWIVQFRASRDQWQNKKFFARAAHVVDWVRDNLGMDAYRLVKGWGEAYPHT